MKGFTLLELLVVILIITLLMAILLPFLQGARKYARTVLCSYNIKQLVYGLSMYESYYKTLPHGFDDTPKNPPPGGYPGTGSYDKRGWWWFNYIAEYFPKEKGQQIVKCPAKNIRQRVLERDILCGNYGVNQSMCKVFGSSTSEFKGIPLNRSDISGSEQTVLVLDSGYSIINWHHAADEPPVTLSNKMIEDTAYVPGLKINEEREFIPGQESDAIDGRHPKKTVNAGFADGHISRTDADDFLVEKTEDDNYKNRSPRWVPKR